ncbi:hypothetical protein [Hyphococcus sp.]|uniref:hypothetical protein n=1 Tax=Hyphococcus sp. TaxID=2038636 RepID=UPI0035C683BC
MAAVFCMLMACFPDLFSMALGRVRSAVKPGRLAAKADYSPAPKPVDNFAPTLEKNEEFNTSVEFFKALFN